jgi:hypothetical protein
MAKTFKAHCPRCDGERNCLIHGEFEKAWNWENGQNYMWGQSDYKLAQCVGCEQVFFHQSSWDSEEWDFEHDPRTGEEVQVNPRTITTFPAPLKKSQKPDWVWDIAKIDLQLHKILEEMYLAYDHGSFILASVGLRTAFDRATEILEIDPSLTLTEKVKTLFEGGTIGETESETLEVVTDAGGAAAHRAWSPDQAEFQKLLITLEHFIHRTVISGKAVLAVAKSIPPRPPRPPKKAKSKP